MSIIVFNGSQAAFILSDSADLSQWPLVIDGADRFINGMPFDPVIVTGVTATVPMQYITQVNGVVAQDTAAYSADQAAESALVKEAHNAPIDAQLLAIDIKTIRPMREGDTVRVAALKEQAAALRATRIK